MSTRYSEPPFVDDRYHIYWNPETGLLDIVDNVFGHTVERCTDESKALQACNDANHRSLRGLQGLPAAPALSPAEILLHDVAAERQIEVIRNSGRSGPHRTSDTDLFAQHQWLLARVDSLTEALSDLVEECS